LNGLQKGRFLILRYATAHTGCSWLNAALENFGWVKLVELWLFHFSSILFSQKHHASWSGIGTFSG
jgi:hypothetical protein